MRALILALLLHTLFSSAVLFGQEAICAKVQMEVRQEVTLARQAFEARMKINNGLPNTTLDNIQVSLTFALADDDQTPVTATADPQNSSALFFYRIEDAPHPTTVLPGSSGQLVWTIIPSASAANQGGADGTSYFLGATLQYDVNGDTETVDVAPDIIRVKPVPELELDYFVQRDVLGDDPFTPIKELPVPFTLGLRVRNVGVGVANDLQIESAQPKIVDNEQGALINFTIQGTEVDGGETAPVLSAPIGNLAAGAFSTVRWFMTATFTGQMTEFSAIPSHSDELGGAVTALLTAAGTHLLVHDVIVDLPGRDGIDDFLAYESVEDPDNSNLIVYESDSGSPNTVVPTTNRFEGLTLNQSGSVYTVTTGMLAPQSFLYMKGTDPTSGSLPIERIVRSDGKILPAQNGWTSRRSMAQPGEVPIWEYYFEIFDYNPNADSGTFTYSVTFGRNGAINRPPQLGLLADRVLPVGQPMSLTITGTDPDGVIPAISLPTRPFTSTFVDNLNGTATFNWTPSAANPAQTGQFPLQFIASDGFLTDSKTITLTVTDGSLIDAWKQRYWPGETDPEIIGNAADPDGDGFVNLDEYALGFDPTRTSSESQPVLAKEEIGGKHYLTYTLTRRTDDPTLTVVVQAASSPSADQNQDHGDIVYAWLTIQIPEVIPGQAPAGFERVRFRDPTALEDSATGRFLRLSITQVEQTQ